MKKICLVIALVCLVTRGEDIGSYAKLECATREEFNSLAAEVHLTQLPSGSLCGDDSQLAKLGKVLKLARRLSTALPKGWNAGGELALRNPIGYLSTHARSIAFDFRQATTLAYNANKGNIFLGAQFFQIDPLTALVMLVHEARHSAQLDPGHTLCNHGDLPFTPLGCDEWMRVDESQGAYAYQVSFELGLAQHSKILGKGDRDLLIAGALGTIGARFNRVPEWLAVPFDVVAVLDGDGKVSFLHPFFAKPVPSDIAVPDEKIVRIEFHDQTNGLLLFTDKQRAYAWRPGGKPSRWMWDLVSADVKVRDVQPLSNGEHTYQYYLDDRNKLTYVTLDAATGKRILVESSLGLGTTPRSRLLCGGSNRRYAIDEKGGLTYFDTTTSTFKDSVFAQEGGWRANTSGVLLSDLYGVGRDGTLFYKDDTKIVKSIFQSEKKAIKYVEGTSLRVLLDEASGISLRRHGGESIKRLALDGSVVDVAIFRTTYAHDRFLPKFEAPNAEFAKQCKATRVERDPWLRRGMGLDDKGRLVFEGDASQPCWTYGDQSWKGFDVEGSEVSSTSYVFAKAALLMKDADGNTRRLYPY